MTRTPTTPTPCYIFDIDGTLADLTHRLHFIRDGNKDWNAFKQFCFFDKPITHMVDLCRRLFWAARAQQPIGSYDKPDWEIILMSGRNECQRKDTMEWLDQIACLPEMKLYMRADGDFRADDIIKEELLAEVRADGFEPIMAFDDRNQVVRMWRRAGVPCAQVAEGDF